MGESWEKIGMFDFRRADGIQLHLSSQTFLISHEDRHLTVAEVLALYALIDAKHDAEAIRTAYSASIQVAPTGARYALEGQYADLSPGVEQSGIPTEIDRVLPRVLSE